MLHQHDLFRVILMAYAAASFQKDILWLPQTYVHIQYPFELAVDCVKKPDHEQQSLNKPDTSAPFHHLQSHP